MPFSKCLQALRMIKPEIASIAEMTDAVRTAVSGKRLARMLPPEPARRPATEPLSKFRETKLASEGQMILYCERVGWHHCRLVSIWRKYAQSGTCLRPSFTGKTAITLSSSSFKTPPSSCIAVNFSRPRDSCCPQPCPISSPYVL